MENKVTTMTNSEAWNHYQDYLHKLKYSDWDYVGDVRNAAHQFCYFLETYTVYENDFWYVRNIIKEIEDILEEEFDYSNKKDKRDDKHRASTVSGKLFEISKRVKRELSQGISMRWKNPA